MLGWRVVEDNKDNSNDNHHNDSNDVYDIEKDISYVFDTNKAKEIVLCCGRVQSGKTNKMFKCLEKAFEEYEYDVTIILAGTTDYLYNQTKERLIAQNYPYKCLFKNANYFYDNSKKYILCVMKNNNGLEQAIHFVKNIYNENAKILILDDEADFASVNIAKNDDYSQTYKKINELYYYINFGKLLQVTATPFANIVSSNSIELRADRVVCWNNSNEYTGLLEFNEHKNECYEILEDCSKNNPDSWVEPIKKCIIYFIITLASNYEQFKNLKAKDFSCLFNINLDTETHHHIKKQVEKNVSDIISSTKNFYKCEIENSHEFKDLINENHFNEFIKEFKENYSINVLNNENKNNYYKTFNFYIGGTLISRGNTFNNLICELIINSPKDNKLNVDTLLQRCRWFGYRNDIIKQMKIFVNQNIYNALNEAIKYVNLLTPGVHSFDELNRKIKILDNESHFVVSTGKV